MDALLWEFREVTSITDCPLYRTQQWLRLPYAAVLAILTSDKIFTDSEDTVLMLLSWWLEEHEGKKCTASEELSKLQGAIRYSRLSAAYLTQAVPHLSRLCVGEKYMLELLEVQSWEAKSAAPFPEQLLQDLSLPAGWLKPARQSNSSLKCYLNLDIYEADLRAKFKNASTRKTRGPMVADFTTSATVRGFRVTLRLGFGQPGKLVCALDMHAQLPRWDTLMDMWPGVPYEVMVSLVDPNRDEQLKLQKRGLVLGHVAWTLNELAPNHSGDPFELAWWDPFLTRGRVRLTAAISLEPPAIYHYA